MEGEEEKQDKEEENQRYKYILLVCFWWEQFLINLEAFLVIYIFIFLTQKRHYFYHYFIQYFWNLS